MVATRVELPDDRGLITGFVFCLDEPPVRLGWPELRRLAEVDQGKLIWLHFNLTDVRAREWIAKSGFLPEKAAAFLLATDGRIRLDRLDQGIIGVLGDLHHDFDLDPESLGLIRFVADAGVLVTGRRHPLMAVDRLRREAIAGVNITSPISLLAHLLGHLAESFETIISGLGDQVDDIEDRILAGRFHAESPGLAGIRRLMSRLRRHLNAERHELTDILTQLPPWCTETDEADLRRAVGRLEAFGQDLDLLYERGRSLQEEIASRRGEATNRNLYVLSIVTTIFLPMTLITGLFGINVGGMPWLESHLGFWWVVFGMFATAIVTFLILHWRRLF
jgi:zinc transporter